jgi:beta-lactamase regulating signal transducer with metallopeptidase domain
MNSLYHLASLVAGTAVSGLFSAVWEGAVLAVCVLLCLRMFPGLSAAARSVVWMSVFLVVIFLHGWPALGVPAGGAVFGRTAAFELGVQWSLGIAAVWAVLSLLRAGQLVWSALRLRGLARRATPVKSDPAIEALLRVKLGGRVGRRAQLCTSDEVERPSVFGFFHPRILLPPALLQRLNETELQQVVLHEMEHLRRADDWTNLVQKLALVLFPLNPALLWVEHRLCAERELACDDSVLKSSCGRKAYALCLTHLAEYTMLRRSLNLALGAWERQSELVRRVHRILRRPATQMSGRRTLALTGGLMAAVIACAAGLAHSPQLVAFNEAAPSAQAQTAQAQTAQAQSDPLSAARFQAVRTGTQQNRAQASFGSARMVNAMMSMTSLPNAAQPANATRRNTTVHAAGQRAVAMQQTWIVMTEWTGDSAPQLVFTVARTVRSSSGGQSLAASAGPAMASQQRSNAGATEHRAQENRAQYAAVPFADGWLIVKI